MTNVKVCGLTRQEDVALACAAGAFSVGFNFSADSPRRVTLDAARGLAEATSPGVLRTGIFVSEESTFIRDAVGAARLDLIQIHRPLREEDLESLPVPVIAVAHVGPGALDLPRADLLSRCRAILFDTGDRGLAGGTGEPFDWGLVAGWDFGLPVLLAGGLNADNVAEAVRRVRPWGVDVASGVESAPGIKDSERMRLFLSAVRSVDAA